MLEKSSFIWLFNLSACVAVHGALIWTWYVGYSFWEQKKLNKLKPANSCLLIIGFHLTSQALLISLSTMLVSFECQIYANNSPFLQWSFSIITWLFRQLHECPERKNNKSTRDSSKGIRVLSEYAKSLESSIKERYWQKILVIRVKALEAYQPYKMSLYRQSERNVSLALYILFWRTC